MKIPEKVMKVLGDESSVKVLSTISNDGKLHSVAAGSIMAMSKKGFTVKAVWTFELNEVFDQSATPNAGTKLA